jgi:hypothetical protein
MWRGSGAQGADMTNKMLNRAILLRLAVGASLALASGALVPVAQAFDFGTEGGLTGSLDTTVSLGGGWRVAAQNPALIGVANGGTGRSVNIDDGDANYAKNDQFSEAYKVTSELSLKYQNYGFFARGSGLYDVAVMDSATRRTPLSAAAKDLAGHYIRLLDAFAYGKWEMGQGHPVELRVGKQIISWGESTFIQGGLSGINPVDVSALRVPGSELKEAYVPQQMIKASLGTTANTSLEAFYLLGWRRTEPEPDGTYFSSNDYVTAGGSHVFLGFGGLSDQGTDFRPLGGQLIQNFQGVPQGERRNPSDSGQFGMAFRWFAPNLGSGTEFSFYFTNYSSHLPLISGQAGTATGIANAAGAATAMEVAAQALVAGANESAAIQAGAAAGYQAAHASGGTVSAATLASYATVGANTYLGGGSLANQITSFATHEFAQTARYYVEYPDNLQTFAVAFNTQLGTSGVALQGQVEYRKDTPLQFDDVELLFSALTPLEQALWGLQNPGMPFPSTCNAAAPTMSRCGQLGATAPGGTVQGWGRYNVWQEQLTATKAFSQVLGAQQMVVVAEIGATNVVGMPDKVTGGPNGQGLRFNGPGTSVSGNAALAYLHYGEVEPLNRFADPFSWGFRLAGKLDYPNLIGSWTISPKMTWAQDVKGTTPGPGGNFVEGRQTLGLGVSANLRNRWQLEFNYTKYAGAGRYNDMIDRDWVAAAIKYSF